MDRKKAYGIDKVTKEDYEKNLEENLANLVKRMKNGSYQMCIRDRISPSEWKKFCKLW